MQARSATFDEAVARGGRVVYSCAAQIVNLSTGQATVLSDSLRIIGSPSVGVDISATNRLSLQSLTVFDPDGSLAPLVADDMLSPYGHELVLESGFEYDDGTTELLPFGVFRIVDVTAAGDGAVVVSLVDRTDVIVQARFEDPYVIAGGTSVVDAMQALLLDRYPGVTVDVQSDPGYTVPLTVFQEGDQSGNPWQNLQTLAVNAGLEVFFGPTGTVVIREPPDPSSTIPEWTYEPGERSLYLGSVNKMDASKVANIVKVSAEGSGVDVSISAKARVTDPSSPIHPDRIGPRVAFLSSPLITTQDQCDKAAATYLQTKAGGSEVLSFTAAPHPAHEGGDVVRVVNDDLGIDVNVVLAKFDMPLLLDSEVKYETAARRIG